ncbi:helix-turn-helix domain-containing protein [Nocardioides sp.]|uniref:helix-turn-helix transcriptional regulator n=1 Tax=Nocardioides sp. TaxID=35761 RepID=UPI00286DB2B5|nr:helix-turn-helix domain-containing protein [Nocardioides sp.]
MPTPQIDLARIAALAEPVRRNLFDFVTRSRTAVSREQAAEGLAIAPHTAKFHLDRLVDEGLLDVEFRRLTGRTGPGSGRPAKLYRRSDRELQVSLPERHYDLLSRILAHAVAEAATTGEAAGVIAARVARAEGSAWGAALGEPVDSAELDRLATALAAGGYEPWIDEQTLFLRNCPFHRVAQEQTELVCGLNLEYVTGVADGVGCTGLTTRLDPGEDRCCVSAAPHR